MSEKTESLKLWIPAFYRIQVQGAVDERYSDFLGGLVIQAVDHVGEFPVTTLYGRLIDQAALMGVLNTLINSMHLPLLSVACEHIGEYINGETELGR